MDVKRSAIEEQARSIERSISTKSANNAALEATVKSAELYFQALRLADSPSERKRIDKKCKELLTQAERLKNVQDTTGTPTVRKLVLKPPTSTRRLTTRENIIILESSKLNGFVFKPWAKAPLAEEFQLANGQSPFTDSAPLPLSASQLETFDGWKRPQHALASLNSDPDGPAPSRETVMHIAEAMDLVQDMTSDCSVVASLCAGIARVERGHPKVPKSINSLNVRLGSRSRSSDQLFTLMTTKMIEYYFHKMGNMF